MTVPVTSRYAQMMTRLSRRIFSEPLTRLNNNGLHVVKLFAEKPLDKRPVVNDYYPPLPRLHKLVRVLRDHGLYRDEHLDFNEEMERQRVLRGKVRPVRGQGKREDKKA